MKAVFFDVGGTLVRPWPSVGAVYATVAARHGIAGEAAVFEESFRRAWRDLRPGGALTSSSKDWWRQVVTRAVPGATAACFEELYAVFARADAWQVFPDVADTLAEARRRGWHVGVISNWDDRLRPLLGALGLTDWDSLTISCETGAEKPAAQVFARALAAAGVTADQALHVGDSYAEDVVGATGVGMRAVLVDRSGRARADCRVVANLRDSLR